MFKNRVLPACGIVLVTFACVLFCRESRMLFFTALALASAYELNQAFRQCGKNFLYIVPAVYIIGHLWMVWLGCEPVYYIAWFGLLCFCGLFKVVLKPSIGAENAVWTLFSMAWPYFFYALLIYLSATEKAGVILTLGILATWACDSAALTVGRACGKHKLAPRVSPNKTWEGAVGGALFSVVAGALLYLILKSFDGPNLICCMVTALVASGFGQVGDLVASLIKRYCGVKDYSRIMGEHGGVMDKMDSMLFSLPMTWFCLYLFGYFG